MSGRDTNFYYSFLVLPPEKRRAIVAVWDFCRAVDDATDEVSVGDEALAAAELARWRHELDVCFGKPGRAGPSPPSSYGSTCPGRRSRR
jgi:phytoene/squalene synthetase